MQWYELLTCAGIPTIIGIIFQLWLTKIVTKQSKKTSEDNSLKVGVQALLRNTLLSDGEKFLARGWIDMAHKQNYENIFQAYHNLGKNGVMSEMYKEVMALPTTKIAKKKPE